MQYKYDLQKLQQGGLIMREYHLIRKKLSFIHQPLSEISSPNMIRFWLLLQDLIKNMNLNLFRSLHLWIYTNLLMSLLFYWLMRRESNNITLLLLNMLCLLAWYIRDKQKKFNPNSGNQFQNNPGNKWKGKGRNNGEQFGGGSKPQMPTPENLVIQ